MTKKDTWINTLHERLDELGAQLDRAYDEAEAAYLDLPREQQWARQEEHRAAFMEWQRRWQELGEKAIRIFDALDALDTPPQPPT